MKRVHNIIENSCAYFDKLFSPYRSIDKVPLETYNDWELKGGDFLYDFANEIKRIYQYRKLSKLK